MQRIIIALALVAVVSAGFTPENYVKAPVVVVSDNETNFNNRSGAPPQLVSLGAGDLTLASLWTNTSVTPSDPNAISWTAFWKKIDNKGLTAASPVNLTYTQPSGTTLTMGYAVTLNAEKDSNGLWSLKVYQMPLTGSTTPLGVVQILAPVNYTIMPAGILPVGKTVYVFAYVADKKVNLTSFTIGGTNAGTEVTVGTTFDTFQVTWGEALGSGQALAFWKEGDARKDGLIDLSKGTVTANTVGGFNATFGTCAPYSTDKKIYGEYCYGVDNGVLKTFIRTNTTTGLVAWSTYNATTTGFAGVQPYGEYLAVFLNNGSVANPTVLSYELWDLSKLNTTSSPAGARKNYLTVTEGTIASNTRIQAGGIYTLIYTPRDPTKTDQLAFTGINVGLLLSGSYLTAILGFVMTIVAGLFLF